MLDSDAILLLILAFIALWGFCTLVYMIARMGENQNKYICYDSEKTYLDSKTSKQKPFPSIVDKASVTLTVVVPAYNEEERLIPMIDETIEVLEERMKDDHKFTYEIIVVDDGSTDRTSDVAQEYNKRFGSDKIRVLKLEKNRGKGGAVRMGMMFGRGESLLFADADGASKFSDYLKLDKALAEIKTEDDLGVVCGSRAHLEKESIAKRSIFRTILMIGFHVLVAYVGAIRGIKDTQCGFKLFTRSAAHVLFYNLHVERWAFDIDLLYMCQCLSIPTAEVAINWLEIPGSKLDPITSSIQMGRDLFLIRLRYLLGIWTITDKSKLK